MRILIIYRHFWPDSPPYASMLRSIGARLVADGHEVTIWAEAPCYKMADLAHDAPRAEVLDGIRVERMGRLPLWGKASPVHLLDKLAFVPRILAKALWRRAKREQFDLVWTATIPPVVQGWTGRTVSRWFGAKFLYHTQDLYPELAGHMGLWRRGGVLYRVMESIERKTRARADVLVALSDDMAVTVRGLADPKRLAVINNFMLDDFSGREDAAPVLPTRHGDRIDLIFAGNLGIFQGLEALVEAMARIATDHPNIHLTFMGEGKALPTLRAQASGAANVHFTPHRPFVEAQAVIAQADFGIVSLEPDIYRFAFPSKTLTYLGLGLPLFVIVEPESNLAQMVEDKGLGVVATDRDPGSIAAALARLPAMMATHASLRNTARAAYDTDMARPVILDRWATEIRTLEEVG